MSASCLSIASGLSSGRTLPRSTDVVLPLSPMRYEGGALQSIEPSHQLGSDNRTVLGELGFDPKSIEDMEHDGVL